MPNQYSFDIEGIEAMIERIDQIEKEVDEKIERTLKRLADKVIDDAKRLAPIDSGDLETELVIGDVKRMLKRMYIDFGTSPDVDDYAVVQHEGFRKTKTGKVVYMSPGPKTESKGMYKGYMPGKKFLENAIKINEKHIIKELQDALTF